MNCTTERKTERERERENSVPCFVPRYRAKLTQIAGRPQADGSWNGAIGWLLDDVCLPPFGMFSANRRFPFFANFKPMTYHFPFGNENLSLFCWFCVIFVKKMVLTSHWIPSFFNFSQPSFSKLTYFWRTSSDQRRERRCSTSWFPQSLVCFFQYTPERWVLVIWPFLTCVIGRCTWTMRWLTSQWSGMRLSSFAAPLLLDQP